jgi:2-polyprenyl-3-methyl-5-hydroxy-6-metoxy-1,4-benzoquinol methylase
MDLKEYEKSLKANTNRHPWEDARLKILSFFITRAEKKNTILDIGSGDTYLSSFIAKNLPNSNVAAVDINYTDAHLEVLKKGKPANFFLFADLLSFTNSFPQKVDIVIMMDVLEHVNIPGELLQLVRQTTEISSSTLFIITVPAYQRLYSKHDK